VSTPQPRRIVVKLGTGVLTSGVGRLDAGRIAAVCAQISALRAQEFAAGAVVKEHERRLRDEAASSKSSARNG